MFSKCFSGLLMLALIFGMAGSAHAAGVKVIVDGKPLDEECVIANGRTLAPVRAIGEAMGATVQWDNGEKKATITKAYYQFLANGSANHGTRTVYIWIGKNEGKVEGGHTVAMDVPAQVINGKTMVPVKALGDMLAAEVAWSQESRTVTVESRLKSTLAEAHTDYLSQQVQLRDVTKNYVENIGKVDTADPLYPYGYNELTMGADESEGYFLVNLKNVTKGKLPERELYVKILDSQTMQFVETVPFTVKALESGEEIEIYLRPIPVAYLDIHSIAILSAEK